MIFTDFFFRESGALPSWGQSAVLKKPIKLICINVYCIATTGVIQITFILNTYIQFTKWYLRVSFYYYYKKKNHIQNFKHFSDKNRNDKTYFFFFIHIIMKKCANTTLLRAQNELRKTKIIFLLNLRYDRFLLNSVSFGFNTFDDRSRRANFFFYSIWICCLHLHWPIYSCWNRVSYAENWRSFFRQSFQLYQLKVNAWNRFSSTFRK